MNLLALSLLLIMTVCAAGVLSGQAADAVSIPEMPPEQVSAGSTLRLDIQADGAAGNVTYGIVGSTPGAVSAVINAWTGHMVFVPSLDDAGRNLTVVLEAVDTAGGRAQQNLTVIVGPPIVPGLDFGVTNGSFYLRSDELDGTAYSHWIKRERPIRVSSGTTHEYERGERIVIEDIVRHDQVLVLRKFSGTTLDRNIYIGFSEGQPSIISNLFRNPLLFVPRYDKVYMEPDTDSINIDVLANDRIEPNSGNLTVVITKKPSHGTATVENDNTVTYAQRSDPPEVDSFRYMIEPPEPQIWDEISDPAFVSLIPRAILPKAGDINVTVAPGQTVVIDMAPHLSDDEPIEKLLLRIITLPVQGNVDLIHENMTMIYTANAGARGQDVIGYRVHDVDARGWADNTDYGGIFIKILPNERPVIERVADARVPVGGTLEFQVAAHDAQEPHQTVSFGLKDAPAGAAIDAVTGRFVWTPGLSQAGTHEIVVTVSDGALAASAGFVVTVTADPKSEDVARAPADDYLLATEDVPLQIDVSQILANDVAGARIAAFSDHRNIRTDLAGSMLTITPEPDYFGPASVRYTISDGGTVRPVPATVSVYVMPVNDPPSIDQLPRRTYSELDSYREILAGRLLTFLVSASDPDGDELVFSLSGAPAGAQMYGSRFDWTPGPGQTGWHNITVTAYDGALSGHAEIAVFVHNASTYDRVRSTVTNDDYIEIEAGRETVIPADSLIANDLALNIFGVDPVMQNQRGLIATTNATDVVSTVRISPDPGFTGLGGFDYDMESRLGNTPASVIVNVTAPGHRPVLDRIGSITIPEGQTLNITASATDRDTDDVDLVFDITGAPADATILERGLTWETGEIHGPGTYRFVVTVSDGAGSSSESVTVVVTEENTPPVLHTIPEEMSVEAGTALSFNATADDPDIPAQDLIIGMTGAPEGATMTSDGRFEWTPAVNQTGTHRFEVLVIDGHGGVDGQRVEVTVLWDGPVPNRPPVLYRIPEMSVKANTTLAFNVTAGDLDLPGQNLTYSMSGQPAGAMLDPVTGRFRWTPTVEQADTHTFEIRVSDGHGGADRQTVTVFVMYDEVAANTPPVLDPIPVMSVEANTTLAFNVTARDGDVPVQTLTYSMSGQPQGAMLDPVTGRFRWTPTVSQAGNWTFTILVTDEHSGADLQAVTIVVTEPVVRLEPVTFASESIVVTAGYSLAYPIKTSNPDDRTVTWEITEGQTGDASMDDDGTFRWDTTTSDSRTVPYRFVLTVSFGAESLSRTLEITVKPPNVSLEVMPGMSDSVDIAGLVRAPAGSTLSVIVIGPPSQGNATVDGTVITYTAGNNASGIDVITYMAAAQGRNVTGVITATILQPTPAAPVAPDIEALTDEDTPVTVRPEVYDPDGGTADITGVTDGRSGRATASAGQITYEPAPDFNGDDQVTYTVTDDESQTATGTINITVRPVNDPPVLDDIDDITVDILEPVMMTLDAHDVDDGPGRLTWSGIGAPEGMEISGGRLTWTPDESQGGRSYTFAVAVSDGTYTDTQAVTFTVTGTLYEPPDTGGIVTAPISDGIVGDILEAYMSRGLVVYAGSPAVSSDEARESDSAGFLLAGIMVDGAYAGDGIDGIDQDDITVFIREIGNVPPVLSEIGHYTVNARDTLTFRVSATDYNGTVSYRLLGAPGGAEISGEGYFSWTPGTADVGGHAFAITAYDRHGATDTKSVTVAVLPAGTPNGSPAAPDVAATVAPGGRVTIIPAISDPDGDRVGITGAAGDAGGTVMPSDDSIEYTAGSAPGTETVTYTVADSRGGTATGMITVAIR